MLCLNDHQGMEALMERQFISLTDKRRKIEQFLASDMGLTPWCKLNRIKVSTFYGWLAYFRDNDPSVFGGYEIAHAGDGHRNWVQLVRAAMSGSMELASVPVESSAQFAIVDTTNLYTSQAIANSKPCNNHASSYPSSSCITIKAANFDISIPSGTSEADIVNVLRAAVSL